MRSSRVSEVITAKESPAIFVKKRKILILFLLDTSILRFQNFRDERDHP
jgi:hypothetical protein